MIRAEVTVGGGGGGPLIYLATGAKYFSNFLNPVLEVQPE